MSERDPAALSVVRRAAFMVLLSAAICPSISFAETLSDPSFFQSELDRIRVEYQIPGMAAAIVLNKQLQIAVSGVRKQGDDAPVEVNDAFQIGSITKPITATLAHLLAEKGILSVKSTILDVFPELKPLMRREYRKVTVEMLLTHLAAFPYKPSREGADEFAWVGKSLKKRRYEYLKAAVQDKPEGKVGEHFVYSGGTIIAAAMMERKTGKSWEHLVRKYIFKPLGMQSAGFGAMSDPNAATGVWEHLWRNGEVSAVVPEPGFAMEVHAPAGRNVHASPGDLAKLMAAHFPYTEPAVTILSRASTIKMQGKSRYADTSPGWFIRYDKWSDWKTVYHYGDNGRSVAAFVFSPKFEAGYIITANIAGDLAWQGVHDLEAEIEEYLAGELLIGADAPRLEAASSALSYGKSASASNVFWEMPEYQAGMALDGNYETRWAADEAAEEAWIEIDLGQPQTVKSILIKEEFAPRVSSFTISAKSDQAGVYRRIARGNAIGDELMLHPRPFTARFVRLDVTATMGPTLSEFQLFGARVVKLR